MAKNSGEDHRQGAVDARTQVDNSQSGNFVKPDRDHDSEDEGQFVDQKTAKGKFKGVAEEPDKRRQGGS